MGFLSQEMTDHDLAAWTDDLLTRIELRVLTEHEVINHQGDDAGGGVEINLKDEQDAVRQYNQAVKVCAEARDDGSKALFERMIMDESGTPTSWRLSFIPSRK